MYDDPDAPEESAAEDLEAPTTDDSGGKHAGEVVPADDPVPPGGDHAGAVAAEVTGHPAVDAVLASLEGLEEQPVAEHVAVFESAHDALRGALNDAGGG